MPGAMGAGRGGARGPTDNDASKFAGAAATLAVPGAPSRASKRKLGRRAVDTLGPERSGFG